MSHTQWCKPTFICWDINACPPPKDEDPFLVFKTIKSAARDQGFRGEAQIRLYGNKQTTEDESIALPDFADAGFINNISQNETAKFTKMLVDMLLWALNTREVINFIVITRLSEETEYLFRGLLAVKHRGSSVFLALPDWSVPDCLHDIKSFLRSGHLFLKLLDFAPGYNEIEVWRCPTLFEHMEDEEMEKEEEEEEEEEEDGDADADADDTNDNQGVEMENITYVSEGGLKPTDFSVDSNSSDTMTTSVFWDAEDYPLPAGFTRSMFYENIKKYLEGKGYNGDVIIWAYASPEYMMEEDYPALAQRYPTLALAQRYPTLLALALAQRYPALAQRPINHNFRFVPKVPDDKYSRLNMMTVDILLWAIDNPLKGPGVPSVLVISRNIEAKTSFPLLLGGFHIRGYTVFLAVDEGDVVPKEAANRVVVLPWEDLLKVGF